MMCPNITPAIQSDICRLAILKQQVWISTYAQQGISEDFASYVHSAFHPEKCAADINNPNLLILLAKNEENLLGCLEIDFSPEETFGLGSHPEIKVLYVLERFQKQGIGKMLLDACLSLLKEKGFQKTWLSVYHQNDKAIRFYEKNNFSKVGEMDFVLNEKHYKNLLLIKNIY